MTHSIDAIIFDVDGTIADTEQFGHLPACNAALKKLELPIQWTWEDFKQMLFFSGGSAQRFKNALEKQTSLTQTEIESLIPQLVTLKQQYYVNQYLPNISLRPGIKKIVRNAITRGIHLAIVSTSYESQIHALLTYRLEEFYSAFNPILGKESGKKTGENGNLYEKCLSQLCMSPEKILVIEDSSVGLKAALSAGLTCAVIYNDYTFGHDFSGARLVASSLAYLDLNRLLNLCFSPIKT